MKSYTLIICLLAAYTSYGQHTADTNIVYNSLSQVNVTAQSGRTKSLIENTQMGKVDIPAAMLAKAPSIGGEPDIIKALQLTPGIKRGTEGSIGMYVRGGGNDENLILLDGAPVYNAGHLLGFFSVFNTATIRDVQMYKSSFPAQYGGRLSSVMDVKTKEASLTDVKASASIGTIASAVSVQMPLIKNKASLMVAGRRTYIDKVLKYIPYHFHDLNTKLMYVANEHNRFYLSSYIGDDKLSAQDVGKDSLPTAQQIQTNMKLGNRTFVLRWNNISANNRHSSDVTLFQSRFQYNINGQMRGNKLSTQSSIQDIGIKADHRLQKTGAHKINSGLSLVHHYFNPNVTHSEGELLEKFGRSNGQKIYTTEAGVYISDDITINDKWQANISARVSSAFVKNKVYANPEPRVSFRYLIDDKSSIKLSYARMAQYMHLVSSASLALPTDLWYPVTAGLKPGTSDQVSAGYYYTIPDKEISITGEAYYKRMRNLTEYKEGALLVLNNDYEKEMVHGHGASYGLEVFVTKTAGRFTGWAGYSLSFAQRKFDSLNNGKKYYSRYDRRHDISLTGMYDINKKLSISANVLYATGSPFTGQNNQYAIPKPDLSGFDIMPSYTGRNEMRLSASFRIDAAMKYKFSIGKINADAQISVYNLLNRTQPYKVQRVWDNKESKYKYQQEGLFGTITAATLKFNI
jgi:hypothetical protein